MQHFRLSTSIDERNVTQRAPYVRELYMNNKRPMLYSSLLAPAGIRFYHGNDTEELEYFIQQFTGQQNKHQERLHVINVLNVTHPIVIKDTKGEMYDNQIIWKTIDHLYDTINSMVSFMESVYVPYVRKKYDIVIINANDDIWETLVTNETYWAKWEYIIEHACECNIIIVAVTPNVTIDTQRLIHNKAVNYFMGSKNMRYVKEGLFSDRYEGHYRPTRLLRGYITHPSKLNVMYIAQRRGNGDINPWAKERHKYDKEVVTYYNSFLQAIEENAHGH